jgi:hypothetical protein
MSSTDPLAIPNPSIVGQTEKTHNANLAKVLTGTRLDEQQWITLQLALGSGERIDRPALVDHLSTDDTPAFAIGATVSSFTRSHNDRGA